MKEIKKTENIYHNCKPMIFAKNGKYYNQKGAKIDKDQ